MTVRPRVNRPERSQVEIHTASLDELVAPDHPVRSIWSFVESLDMSEMYGRIKAAGSRPGRAATDPRLLLALWILATSEGVGSGRELARLCERDLIYRWLCGGVSVNYHSLSDFRAESGNDFDALLTQVLGPLMQAGIVTLRAVTQDGTKVRANAGASSFRREASLAECLKEAEAEVARLRADLHCGENASKARREAARVRAAEERMARVKAALAQMPEQKAVRAREQQADRKRAAKRGEPRISTTDPDARVMKMADGGFRPAVNVQLATDVDSGMVVGVAVTNQGTDSRQLEPMVADLLNRTGELPEQYLVDGGYATAENIEGLTAAGVVPYAPPRKPRNPEASPYEPKYGDSDDVKEWRARMATDEAKKIYRDRAATAERVNAELKSKYGLTAVTVRGLTKIKSVALLAALTFNALRMISLDL